MSPQICRDVMGKTGKICLGRLGGDVKVSPLLATRPYALWKLKFDEDGFGLMQVR